MPLLLTVSALLSLVLAVWTLGKREAPGAIPFVGVLAGIFFYSLGYAAELVTPPGGPNAFWNHFQYLGVATLPAFWLWLSIEAPRSEPLANPVIPMLLLAEGFVTLVLNLTNDLHHFYYVGVSYELQGDLTLAVIVPGPWYLFHVLFTLVSFPLGALHFYLAWRRHGRHRGSPLAAVVLATLPTLAAFVLYQLKVVPGGLDVVPLGLSVTSILYFWLLWPFRLFDLRPVTREAVFRLVPNPVVVIDPAGRLVDWNPAAIHLFPFLSSFQAGMPLADAFADHPAWRAVLVPDHEEGRTLLPWGPLPTWWAVTSAPVTERGGRLAARVFLLHEQTELVHRAEVSEQRASLDALTGCLNRRGFVERSESRLGARGGRQDPVAVIGIDLDHFKALNDREGHAAGDAALCHAVRVWQSQLRAGDLLGRTGGEEFAVLLPGTRHEVALAVADRLCSKLRSVPLEWEGRPLTVTGSFGVTGAADSSRVTLNQLLRNADAALYEAKERGRDRVVLGALEPSAPPKEVP